MFNRNRIHANQSGFTLVEIAIVLVIIGLLIGGILKGQELITNAKIKNLGSDLKSVSTAYYAYLDRYKAIPGDDLLASTRFTGAVNGGGNSVIAGVYDATPAGAPILSTEESNLFWQHTRMAGLMSGDAVTALPPANAVGGKLGIEQQAATAYGLTGAVVCASQVPWKIAQAVDIAMDDGVSDTGMIRAGADGVTATAAATAAIYGPAVPATAALEKGIHTICMSIK